MNQASPAGISRRQLMLQVCRGVIGAGVVLGGLTPAAAQSERRGASGAPLPRFAVISPGKARMRVGPGFNYATSWIYKRPGLPVEIIEEYSVWRQVRDADGTTGWMHVSVLSSTRNAMVAPWLRNSDNPESLAVHSRPSDASREVAKIEPGVVVHLAECDGTWCKVEVKGTSGYMQQIDLWGAYPGEVFK